MYTDHYCRSLCGLGSIPIDKKSRSQSVFVSLSQPLTWNSQIPRVRWQNNCHHKMFVFCQASLQNTFCFPRLGSNEKRKLSLWWPKMVHNKMPCVTHTRAWMRRVSFSLPHETSKLHEAARGTADSLNFYRPVWAQHQQQSLPSSEKMG